MLTDGAISDMVETKKSIIRASRLPMSIIIVGVGGADFAAMDELDADEKRCVHVQTVAHYITTSSFISYLTSPPPFPTASTPRLQVGSEVAERDIVQFVPFRKFAHVSLVGTLSNKMTLSSWSCSLPWQASPEVLASAVLAEVPQQLTEYMRKKGITPATRR